MALPKSYKQAAFKKVGGNLILETVPLQHPERGQVLVKVETCGICHSDVFSQRNPWGAGFPIVPGHEIIGNVGDRIGGGWHGGHDQTCDKCRQGFYQFCQPMVVNGVTKNGGYAEYCLLWAHAAVRVPVDVDAAKFAPMLCAGPTVFTAIRSAGLQPGDTVAIQGLGGLGHIAVQMARKMGFRVITISRDREKEKSIRDLGAPEYIDATAGDAGKALVELGYAKLVVTTALDSAAMAPLIKGIGIMGKMAILSIPESGALALDIPDMIMRGVSVRPWPVSSCNDFEKTVDFAHLQGLDCAVETFPLEKAQEAFDAMLSGKVRYRAVLRMTRGSMGRAI
ncbi:alcohol dehydrogenase GroES-like domain-containing protein [Xylariomycetidae sp. FL2044]|nr:alcohol dehydrogenase GroES-like domain-containing protein [Xylariomycetidae sp. FL2044]